MREYADQAMRGEAGRWKLSYAPSREFVDYTLEYYVEARDDKGRVVGRVASPERPIPLAVHGVPNVAAGPTPWFKRWYVWAAVGGVVAVAANSGVVPCTSATAPKESL